MNWFTHLTKRSVREVLEELRDAGLGSLPGGGAEIFHPEVRDQICEHKADGHNWLEIHRTAHELGPAIERHHALRPLGKRVPPHRSPGAAA